MRQVKHHRTAHHRFFRPQDPNTEASASQTRRTTIVGRDDKDYHEGRELEHSAELGSNPPLTREHSGRSPKTVGEPSASRKSILSPITNYIKPHRYNFRRIPPSIKNLRRKLSTYIHNSQNMTCETGDQNTEASTVKEKRAKIKRRARALSSPTIASRSNR